MSVTYCFANYKGGVGKTTLCLNIGAGLAKLDKKVLLIDMDPQSNLSIGLGYRQNEDSTIYHVLSGKCSLKNAIITKSKNLDFVPSSLELSYSELELAAKLGREKILKKMLVPILNNYDFILIDCPPSGLLTVNSLAASQLVFIPVQCEFYALNGFSKFMKVIEEIRQEINPNLRIGGIIATRYDNRKVLNREVLNSIKKHYPEKLFKTIVRENIAIAEAPGAQKDIFDYKPSSKGASDFKSLINEFILSGDRV